MKDLKHTPGPWEFNGGRQVVFQDSERYKDCDLWDIQYEDESEMKANAKLIAAAPELLEALKIMLEDNGYDIDSPIEQFSKRTQQVIVAYKKATE
jgi:N-acetyl-anhydromuramyl-L-alanine amidase AmpD